MNWDKNNYNNYIKGTYGNFKLSPKLACFDLDSTLIKTKSNKRFPVDEDDWVFYARNVGTKLNELSRDGFCIVIVTNQSSLKLNNKIVIWQKKLQNIADTLKLPLLVLCANQGNIYRKPLPGFFEFLNTKNNPIDLTSSFYCGDACGRNDDHSDCDLKFALNCGLKFRLPEDLFNESKSVVPKINYLPFEQINKNTTKINFIPQEKEVILMVGYQGSGKSTFVNDILVPLNYIRVNRDTLGTTVKCRTAAEKSLKKGDKIVIDNTNPSVENREEFIKLAKKYNYSVRCIIMDTPFELALHNAIYRAYKNNSKFIPTIAYNVYKKNYVEPSTSEGIKEVIHIVPEFNVIDQDYYKLYMY